MKSYQNFWQPMLTINWKLPEYCTSGLYIIYARDERSPLLKALKPLPPVNIIRIGQGVISERLKAHSKNYKITKYGNPYSYDYIGRLYATCTEIPFVWRDGIERFLADYLKPLVGDRFPYCASITVNLPKNIERHNFDYGY